MSRALDYCYNIHVICCRILGIKPINVVGCTSSYDGYRGSHNLSQSVLEVNQKLIDESDSYDTETQHSDYILSLWVLSGIVAHETMHLYQEHNITLQRVRDTLYEAQNCQDFRAIDSKVYYNLSIELEANAFAAFIEEKTLESYVEGKEHYPLNPATDMKKFQDELNRMYQQYDEKYNEVMKQIRQ